MIYFFYLSSAHRGKKNLCLVFSPHGITAIVRYCQRWPGREPPCGRPLSLKQYFCALTLQIFLPLSRKNARQKWNLVREFAHRERENNKRRICLIFPCFLTAIVCWLGWSRRGTPSPRSRWRATCASLRAIVSYEPEKFRRYKCVISSDG